MAIKCNEVNVTAKTAGTEEGVVVITIQDQDEKKDYDFALSKQQVKWLRTALKQAYVLAFK